MATSRFEIPAEYQDKIKFVESLDKRTDEEIFESILNPPPVTSEKNIWAFWHSGLREMPAWCQRNVANWARTCGPSWTIRVLESGGSTPSSCLNWVKEEDLPETFVRGTMDGPAGYKGPHSADFLRGICLYQYGGVWLDVGAILIRSLDDLCWRKLEDPNSPYQVAGPWMYGQAVANHVIASRKGDPFTKIWHDLFMELWKNRTTSDGLIDHPLMQFAQKITLHEAEARGFSFNWDVPMHLILEYVCQIVCWIRVSICDGNGGFNGLEYYKNNVLLFDALYEDWPGEAVIGWNGEEMFELLSTRLDADPESEAYKKAHKMVWTILSTSSMQKVTRAGGKTSTKALGALWDDKENADTDREPGTFAELLRYGSVHFRQDRETLCVPAPEVQEILHKGVLEP
ncbi:putative glycosyl transferase FCK3 [Colletotrichum spinosum]|uniref:Putative glycosyl transferase FCK3 n=1 Tax=Colletotrichum spinosum TaxID=1347390 RepID=A0A4R8Q7R7_9PEZI|nr:putative glycosyl transferase FCK3 [Colletotrichum spinosum]